MTAISMDSKPGWVPDGDFSDRLAQVRSRMGWNYKEAGEACGLDGEAWSRWELEGARPQHYEAICRIISKASGCNDIWLMTGQVVSASAPPARVRRRERRASIQSWQSPEMAAYEAARRRRSGFRTGYRSRRVHRHGIVPGWGGKVVELRPTG